MSKTDRKSLKHILCAVDGSGEACRAAEMAGCIARDMQARITIISVAKAAKMTPELEKYAKTEGLEGQEVPLLVVDAENCLNKALGIARDCGASAVQSFVRVGNPFDQISTIVDEESVDLVVLGHHARTSVSRLTRKPLSQRIADEIPVKLLLVP